MDVFQKQLSRWFPAAARRKARDLFYDEAVQELDFGMGPGRVRAAVKGSAGARYDVNIDYGTGKPTRMHCSCPRFAEGYLCKHLYVVLMELDDICDENGIETFFDHYPVLGAAESVSASEFGSTAEILNGGANWQRAIAGLLSEVGRSGESHHVGVVASGATAEARVILTADKSTDCKSFRCVFAQRERTKSGRWGKWKDLAVELTDLDRFDSVTRHALQELVARNDASIAKPNVKYNYSWQSGNYYLAEYPAVAIGHAAARGVFKSLANAGLLYWSLKRFGDDLRPLAWDKGPEPWRFEVDIAQAEGNCEIRGVFRCGERDSQDVRELLPNQVLAAVPGLAMIVPGQGDSPSCIAPLDVTPSTWLRFFLQRDKFSIPETDREEFLKATARLGMLPEGQRPEDWEDQIPKGQPRPILRLERLNGQTRSASLVGRMIVGYEDYEITPEDPDLFIEVGDSLLQRDIDAEVAFVEELVNAPGRDFVGEDAGGQSGQQVLVLPQELTSFVEYLTSRNWTVEADGSAVHAGSSYWMSVDGRQETGIDWFDLNGEASFGKASAQIPELLAAIERGQDYVVLDDGSQGLLPQDWIEKFKPLAGMATNEDRERATFRASQALLLDAMLSEHNVQVDFAETYLKIRDRIASAANPKPKGRPPGFRGNLRDYQKQGVGWLWFLRDLDLCGCLADDMGLGKTIQVLAHLEHVRRELEKQAEAGDEGSTNRRVFLAVVPKSLVFNWCDEAARFTPKMRVAAYHGTGRQELLDQLDEIDLLVTTYGTMRIDIESLKEIPFDTVILDESQAIKNGLSQVAKATRLLDARHRIAMTGTPVENHLGELWSLFEFLNPGMLGRSSVFKDAVRASKPTETGVSNFDAVRTLGKAIRPFLLRRTKDAVLTELPPKTEQQIFVELSKSDRKAYNDLAAHYRAQLDQTFAEKGFEKSHIVVLEALLRLRQAACHPGLLDPKKKSKKVGKIEVLLEQIDEVIASGHKALVFSQFVKFLDIARIHLDKAGIPYEYLDGKTRDRKSPVERFQNNPEVPLFLISLKAGGHGLNLTAADHVFILDPWWNPAVEAQAVDRSHRMGQERPVVASRLITRGTVEEKIEQLKASKKELAEALVSNGSAVPRGLTREDVQLLLS